MHDFAGGKADWAVHGLPLEGRTAGRRRVIDVARKDIPTCGPREPLGAVRDRVRAAGHDVCIVVNERGIVLGRLRRDEEWNLTNFACWWSYASGTYLDFNRWFGTIGRLNKTAVQQAC